MRYPITPSNARILCRLRICATSTHHGFVGGESHFAAKEVELQRTLGDRLVQATLGRRSDVQKEIGAGEAAAVTEFVAGADTTATVRVAWLTRAVCVGVLQSRTAGDTVRTVLEVQTRMAVLRSLKITRKTITKKKRFVHQR